MSDKKRTYPTLSTKQRLQLIRIEPSVYLGLEYRPCRLTLRDGTLIERAYVVSAEQYHPVWGIWPEDDDGKSAVDIAEVADIAGSPERLPKRFADEVYGAKETMAGHHIFRLEWRDEYKQTYVTGSAVDFLPEPSGHRLKDALIVHPHKGKGDPATRRGLRYHWCLFEN